MTYLHIPSTCRFCSGTMHHYQGIKYGPRHYAHFACYLDAGKPLSALHRWQVEGFPFRLLQERGLVEEVEMLTAEAGR